MPPPLLCDLAGLDLTKVVVPREEIEKVIPQRYEMAMLDGIVYVNDSMDTAVGYKDVLPDDWWTRGHIPGRPLMPGVLMIECAAQLCAYCAMKLQPMMGFMGFAKCDDVRFRGTIVPPSRLFMVGKMLELSRRRAKVACQGFVNNQMVFEAVITGMPV